MVFPYSLLYPESSDTFPAESEMFMSIYVMSDIHGCYDRLNETLSLISLSNEDELILAGDYVDRGNQSLEVLRWIASKPENVTFLKGNHDAQFAHYVRRIAYTAVSLAADHDFSDTDTLMEAYDLAEYHAMRDYEWFDAYGTISDLILQKNIRLDELLAFGKLLDGLPCVATRSAGGRNYIIVHAGYTESLDRVSAMYRTLEDFYLEARTDAFTNGGKAGHTIISGHTPTVVEGLPTFTGGTVFFHENLKDRCRFYDIDCGCVFRENGLNGQGRLACIRLGDEKIFYC